MRGPEKRGGTEGRPPFQRRVITSGSRPKAEGGRRANRQVFERVEAKKKSGIFDKVKPSKHLVRRLEEGNEQKRERIKKKRSPTNSIRKIERP